MAKWPIIPESGNEIGKEARKKGSIEGSLKIRRKNLTLKT